VFAYIQHDGSWFINNTGFIADGDGVLSIHSCATEARTRAYFAAIRTVTARQVTPLVNTQHHPDHTNGNGLLGATAVVAHARCRDQLACTAWPPPVPVFGPADRGQVAPALQGICFERRLELHHGGRRIELLRFGTPAHTTNDIVAWLPGDRVLFAGDLVFNGATPFACPDRSPAGWRSSTRSASSPGHHRPRPQAARRPPTARPVTRNSSRKPRRRRAPGLPYRTPPPSSTSASTRR
jgi:cyclase